jgi:cellulose biosynthesis protein BcsQ
MILIIGSEKGGCAKSTLAINLSIVSVLEGIDTLLVDADTQGSCNEFSQRRDEVGVAPRIQVLMKHERNLHRELADLKSRYQRVNDLRQSRRLGKRGTAQSGCFVNRSKRLLREPLKAVRS